MSGKTAKDLGYVHESIESLEAPEGYDLVTVGTSIKRGDEFFSKDHEWTLVRDEHIGKVIASNFRPVRRRKRWSCWHVREDRDKYCPVCSVFYRYVTQRW